MQKPTAFFKLYYKVAIIGCFSHLFKTLGIYLLALGIYSGLVFRRGVVKHIGLFLPISYRDLLLNSIRDVNITNGWSGHTHHRPG